MRKALLLPFLLLFACSSNSPQEPQLTEFSGVRMTILYRVLVGGELDSHAIQELIDSVFQEIDLHFNDWNPDSEVSRLRKQAPKCWHAVSPQLAAHLRQIDALVRESDGRFDPSVGQRAHFWKAALQHNQVPKEEELAQVPYGWQHYSLQGDQLFWDVEGMSLDLGGIAKGLAIDMISTRLQAAGYKDTYVEWGGEMRVSGQHPSGRPWQIEVRELNRNKTQLLALKQAAVATSGDYLQSWTVDEISYSHILDPRTGCPLMLMPGQIASVTVITDSAVRADALATAAMLFSSLDEAEAWASKINDAAFYFQVRAVN